MSNTEVRAFFETYRDAFNRLDGDAVADLWHTPSAITDAQGDGSAAQITLWTDDASMRTNHRALSALYRRSGYHNAGFEIVDCVSLGTPMHLPLSPGRSGAWTARCCKPFAPATTCCARRRGRRGCSPSPMKKTSTG